MAELAGRLGRYRRCRDAAAPRARARPGLLGRARQSRDRPLPAEPARRGDRRARLAARARRGDNPGHQNLKAAALGRLGSYEEAIALYEQVLAKLPRPAQGLDELRPCAEDGRPAGGRRSPPIAARSSSRPTLGEVWWSLANLKTVTFGDADVAAMEAALAATGLSARGPPPPPFRARQGARGARRFRRRLRPLCRGQPHPRTR